MGSYCPLKLTRPVQQILTRRIPHHSILPAQSLRLSPSARRAMSSYTLNRDIFNPSLYRELQDFWFEGQELGATEVKPEVAKRWFGAGSPEDKTAFDGACREKFRPALEAIGPDNFPNQHPEVFVQEVRDALQRHPQGDGSEAAWTALSIILLLDQIPRNIFRTNDRLAKVYGHYDKISYAFMEIMLSEDSPIHRPDLHPQWRMSVVHRTWWYLPLIHSEKLESHDRYMEIMGALDKELEREEGLDSMKHFMAMGLKAEKEHRDILDRFGRYPHRNQALERTSTPKEEKFLAEGGATFGVSQEK